MANKPQGVTWASSVTGSFHSLVALLIAVLVVSSLYLSRDRPWLGSPTPTMPTRECDLFSGRWVYDDASHPLYEEKRCPYKSSEITCDAHGRKDTKYQKWRWQPHGCDLPRFNATAFLEKLRNKRLVYVGDSLNRGQWHSLVCMVEPAIPAGFKSMSRPRNASLRFFTAHEYNATIEFYWAPLLVESNCDDPQNHSGHHRIARVRSIENHAKHWRDADFLIFNTYLWWRLPEMELLWGSFESPAAMHKVVKMPRAYEMALNTWSDWLEAHVNRSKTKLFFATMSPSHENAKEWGGIPGQSCYGETEPITREGYRGTGSVLAMMRVVERVIKKLETRGVTVHVLNITQLSEYRKDAHPAINRKYWHPLTKEQLANPVSYADCFHWCLPGLPDVWNELLYTYIFHILDT
ncbi:protein trichome birefringence-like 34 [Rhodamnia argentea]|uniref:Protein trichome birefringence-like 34 n=1 Tax=Rhodamnia argentea TaxID=178133 RepID=A0A8B8QTQ8_9MYRT|nr:protein trichome birefringence-like 34 [Rhodamnia argentea]